MFIHRFWDPGDLQEKIRVLRIGVEPLTFWLVVQMLRLLESFRFEDKDDYEYEF